MSAPVTAHVHPQGALPVDDIRALLDGVNALKAEMRRHSMEFQSEYKQQVARFLRVPAETFYGLSLQEWMTIWRRYQRFAKEAEYVFHVAQASVPDFYGMTGQTLLGEIWYAYKCHVERAGRDVFDELIAGDTVQSLHAHAAAAHRGATQ